MVMVPDFEVKECEGTLGLDGLLIERPLQSCINVKN